ncbi:hypothetical protein Micau_0687 [Micromonospora aurantiaca ATCC 27029]|nr:hypothetical protein Micau_0687 [Micromonospora aurantiaca ATCC 27029]
MAKAKLIIRSGILALALAGLAGTFAAAPAQAHDAKWSKTRNGCKYSGGVVSNHTYAWTQRDSGGCSGHPWLWVISCDDGGQIVHSSNGYTSLSGTKMYQVYHKTQENESWELSHLTYC